MDQFNLSDEHWIECYTMALIERHLKNPRKCQWTWTCSKKKNSFWHYFIWVFIASQKTLFSKYSSFHKWFFWKSPLWPINFRVGQFIVRCENQLENSIANQRLIGVQGLPKPNWHAYQTNAQVIKWYIPRMNSSWKITLKSLGWFF